MATRREGVIKGGYVIVKETSALETILLSAGMQMFADHLTFLMLACVACCGFKRHGIRTIMVSWALGVDMFDEYLPLSMLHAGVVFVLVVFLCSVRVESNTSIYI